ncbi:hypothetical protein BO71DRAFT_427400 [Aspergillus ellipticus CBS 707.79]|uniref:Uncharacterized protein n=1 Tax=Aspergillus ellipticus CBS 707.79 TaxID=1448320 RepID=A0A319EYZ2_9EURO|nr:hypothetical protein BO71DRAFT_427400 [Aspergillus ellipticus CBS 707.79]
MSVSGQVALPVAAFETKLACWGLCNSVLLGLSRVSVFVCKPSLQLKCPYIHCIIIDVSPKKMSRGPTALKVRLSLTAPASRVNDPMQKKTSFSVSLVEILKIYEEVLQCHLNGSRAPPILSVGKHPSFRRVEPRNIPKLVHPVQKDFELVVK